MMIQAYQSTSINHIRKSDEKESRHLPGGEVYLCLLASWMYEREDAEKKKKSLFDDATAVVIFTVKFTFSVLPLLFFS